MPDQYGFDHLGRTAPTVRCIEEGCDEGGPLYQWPEQARRKHWRGHGSDRTARAERQRQTVAAYAEAAAANELTTDDAEEATMAKTATSKSSTSKAGKGRPKRQPRSNTELNKILKDDRDEYVLYERAHTALRKAEKSGDTAEAAKQQKVKAKHKVAHSRYWGAYEELRAKKRAAENGTPASRRTSKAKAEPAATETISEATSEAQADELPEELQ